MADRSKIEWTDATWNPVQATHIENGKSGWHCEKVSPACRYCYAETHNGRRLPNGGTGLPYDRASRDMVVSLVSPDTLVKPFSWKRGRKIFVESMSDLFGDWVAVEEIARVFAVMYDLPHHTFQVLTKRATRMAQVLNRPDFRALVAAAAYEISIEVSPEIEGTVNRGDFLDDVYDRWPFKNVWLGVTAEDDKWANARIPALLSCPAVIRWVSYEPALDRVNWNRFNGLNWIVCGGESGANARPMHPLWAKDCRDYCQARGIPFLFKQWGTWQPANHGPVRSKAPTCRIDTCGRDVTELSGLWDEADEHLYRVGKVNAGRRLSGREWSQFPEEPANAV